MTAEDLLEGLRNNPMERLRWMVLREFGIIPGSRKAKSISDFDILRCAAHMVIDNEAENNKAMELYTNESFDEKKFRELAHK